MFCDQRSSKYIPQAAAFGTEQAEAWALNFALVISSLFVHW